MNVPHLSCADEEFRRVKSPQSRGILTGQKLELKLSHSFYGFVMEKKRVAEFTEVSGTDTPITDGSAQGTV